MQAVNDDDDVVDSDALSTLLSQYCIMFLKHERESLIDRTFMEKSQRRGAKCECGMHAILADRN